MNPIEKISKHWDAMSTRPIGQKIRFYQHPRIYQHINEIVCGEPLSGECQGAIRLLEKHLEGKTLDRAISVGAGGGGRVEMDVLESSLVKEFDAYELSRVRYNNAHESSKKRNLDKRFHITRADGIEALKTKTNHYDLVFWKDALHHMLDVQQAASLSKSALRVGGFFLMSDFIGPSRFQWTDFNLSIASKVRAVLPDHLLVDPMDPTKRLPTQLTRPNVSALIANDPSEAADSGRIIDAVRTAFPDAKIILTGGAIFHIALNHVLANMTSEDAPLLELCLIIDKLCADMGTSHFAVAIARKGGS